MRACEREREKDRATSIFNKFQQEQHHGQIFNNENGHTLQHKQIHQKPWHSIRRIMTLYAQMRQQQIRFFFDKNVDA